MKEQNENTKQKKPKLSKEKKFYLFTAIGCAAALLAIIIVAVIITNSNSVENVGSNNNSPTVSAPEPDTSVDKPNEPTDEQPVVTVPEGMVSPVSSLALLNDHGFYHNVTLNCYYEHAGVDFSASAGAEVFAAEDGVVESIYKDDILLGTQIVIDHGNGLKTSYTFVNESEGLKVGASVKKGEVIATVAEPTGKEYKDGAHLHFEVLENGKSVDPSLHLTMDEK